MYCSISAHWKEVLRIHHDHCRPQTLSCSNFAEPHTLMEDMHSQQMIDSYLTL